LTISSIAKIYGPANQNEISFLVEFVGEAPSVVMFTDKSCKGTVKVMVAEAQTNVEQQRSSGGGAFNPFASVK